jgi:hypothetical protein
MKHGVNYKFLRICNTKIKFQRLNGGNETNDENNKKNRTISRDDIKTITEENPSSGREDTAEQYTTLQVK